MMQNYVQMERLAYLDKELHDMSVAGLNGDFVDFEKFQDYQNEALGMRNEMTRKRARDVGASLCQAISSKKPRSEKSQLWHVRLSVQQFSFDEVHAKLHQMAKRFWIVKSAEFAYVFEQSGVDDETRGKNVHVHIRLRSTFLSNLKGRLRKEVLRVTKLTDGACQLIPHDNVNALKSYMSGNKTDPAKLLSVKQDEIWRMENGLDSVYIVKNNV